MQAILTKYLPASNHRPSRIRAWCDRGAITISYEAAGGGGFGNDSAPHLAAVRQLCARFIDQDVAKYGEASAIRNAWGGPISCGSLPNKSRAAHYCFIIGNRPEIGAVIDRLTAWAECNEQRARSLPDGDEAKANSNSAANYRELARLLMA